MRILLNYEPSDKYQYTEFSLFCRQEEYGLVITSHEFKFKGQISTPL